MHVCMPWYIKFSSNYRGSEVGSNCQILNIERWWIVRSPSRNIGGVSVISWSSLLRDRHLGYQRHFYNVTANLIRWIRCLVRPPAWTTPLQADATVNGDSVHNLPVGLLHGSKTHAITRAIEKNTFQIYPMAWQLNMGSLEIITLEALTIRGWGSNRKS